MSEAYLSDAVVDEYCRLISMIRSELEQVGKDFKLTELFFANVNQLCGLSKHILDNVDRAAWERAASESDEWKRKAEHPTSEPCRGFEQWWVEVTTLPPPKSKDEAKVHAKVKEVLPAIKIMCQDAWEHAALSTTGVTAAKEEAR